MTKKLVEFNTFVNMSVFSPPTSLAKPAILKQLHQHNSCFTALLEKK